MTTLAPSFLIGSSSFFILAGNKDNYKISSGVEIRPDQTLDCGVSCPWASGKNVVTTLVFSFLNRSYSFLQIRRTTIKAWISLNFVNIPSTIMELAALEHLKKWIIMLWPLYRLHRVQTRYRPNQTYAHPVLWTGPKLWQSQTFNIWSVILVIPLWGGEH